MREEEDFIQIEAVGRNSMGRRAGVCLVLAYALFTWDFFTLTFQCKERRPKGPQVISTSVTGRPA